MCCADCGGGRIVRDCGASRTLAEWLARPDTVIAREHARVGSAADQPPLAGTEGRVRFRPRPRDRGNSPKRINVRQGAISRSSPASATSCEPSGSIFGALAGDRASVPIAHRWTCAGMCSVAWRSEFPGLPVLSFNDSCDSKSIRSRGSPCRLTPLPYPHA